MKTIMLARKPLVGTVASNVLEHGCGGLNIDGTRVGVSGGTTRTNGSNAGRPRNTLHGGNFGVTPLNSGRFPANLILQHLDGCEQNGVRYVKGHKGYPNGPGGIWKKGYQQDNPDAIGYTQCSTVTDNEPWKGHADKDGKEAVANWVCENGCPVARLDEQSGERPSGGSATTKDRTDSLYEDGLGQRIITPYTDTGGASRFFKQVKK